MKGILKGLFSLFISIIGIVSFCNAETIEFSSAFISSPASYSFSSNNRNYLLSNMTKAEGKYFCYSNAYYGSTTTVISRLGDLKIYFCDDNQPGNSTDLSSIGYCHLVKSGIVGSTDSTILQTTGYNCTLPDYSNVNSNVYVYISRDIVGSSASFNYSSVVSFLGVLANSTDFLNKFNLVNQNNISCPYTFNVYDFTTATTISTGINRDIRVDYWSENVDYYDLGGGYRFIVNENNYILKSSINQNYCESNNLCPIYTGDSGNCNTGDINWSSLYINNIQHLGGPSIYLNIPEEFNWDYQYSSNDDMYIDIEGYNVNYDSISGAIAIQNYKPDSSDLNKIITELIPLFIPGLVIILFLYFVFRFIKKIF